MSWLSGMVCKEVLPSTSLTGKHFIRTRVRSLVMAVGEN